MAIGAAFAAGHYMSQPESPPPIASAQTTPAAPPPAAEPAPSTQPEEAAPAPAAPAPVVKVKPPKRVADYASGEDEYAPPPPPPPPPLPPAEFRDHPNPFAGQFNTFPMRHSGAGTISSPLTFQAQTALGNDREADLRISILVPQPSPNDRGQFWREWGGRDQADLMPDITRGTPVIVTGSASVVVTVDPEILDLDAPAILTLSGRDGQRIYRSRDVAPARGEAWDSRGARWIFVPDAEFYDLLRDGADASISVRNRIDGRSIRIPFDTSDFPPSARRFERIVSQRIDDFAEAWNRARPGAPPPVNRLSGPPVILPPPVNNPPQKIASEAKAKEIRFQLESLHGQITRAAQDGLLPADEAKSWVKEIRGMLVQLHVEFFTNLGLQAMQENQPRQARLAFERGVQYLQKQPEPAHYQNQLQQLKAQLDRANALVLEKAQPSADEPNALTEGLKSLEDDDTWKKKNIYD